MSEQDHAEPDYKTYQLIGLFLGPLGFLAVLLSPAPAGLSEAGWITAGLAAWMAVWWATEALPLFATALLPLIVLPLFGIANMRAATAPFANPVVFLLFGGFLIGLAVQRWNLHRRIAFHIIRRVGDRPHNLVGGVMLASAALSMWISNTATTIMMLPIALSLIFVVAPQSDAADRNSKNFATAMVLGVAYASSIGGMATLIGSPPNALAASYLEQSFGIEVTFPGWMVLALPIVVVMLVLSYLLLTRVVFPFSAGFTGKRTDAVAEMLVHMGSISRPEKRVAMVFAAIATGWILYPFINAWTGLRLSDTGIAIAGALALFAIPADWRKRIFLLDLATARKMPWDVLILFGGGLSLAQAIDSSGLAAWMGAGLSFLHGAHLILIVGGVALLIVFLTELMSNTATTATFLPVAGSLALGAHVGPVWLAMPVALAASSAYMLPVATLPNAIVFGTGYVTLPQMLRAGLWLSLIGAVVITASIALAASLF
jgi:solute carrier family 13 (sodium-dependent dicarboxylate transporter), member 2/3/5